MKRFIVPDSKEMSRPAGKRQVYRHCVLSGRLRFGTTTLCRPLTAPWPLVPRSAARPRCGHIITNRLNWWTRRVRMRRFWSRAKINGSKTRVQQPERVPCDSTKCQIRGLYHNPLKFPECASVYPAGSMTDCLRQNGLPQSIVQDFSTGLGITCLQGYPEGMSPKGTHKVAGGEVYSPNPRK